MSRLAWYYCNNRWVPGPVGTESEVYCYFFGIFWPIMASSVAGETPTICYLWPFNKNRVGNGQCNSYWNLRQSRKVFESFSMFFAISGPFCDKGTTLSSGSHTLSPKNLTYSSKENGVAGDRFNSHVAPRQCRKWRYFGLFLMCSSQVGLILWSGSHFVIWKPHLEPAKL